MKITNFDQDYTDTCVLCKRMVLSWRPETGTFFSKQVSQCEETAKEGTIKTRLGMNVEVVLALCDCCQKQ